jgi:hypothetical protein
MHSVEESMSRRSASRGSGVRAAFLARRESEAAIEVAG